MIVVTDVENSYSRKYMTVRMRAYDVPLFVTFEVVEMQYCGYVENVKIHGDINKSIKKRVRDFLDKIYEYNLKAPV